MKILYCVGIYREGGLSILKKLVDENRKDHFFLLDSRLKGKINVNNSKFINNNLIYRFIHMFFLSLKIKKNDHIFFINGLPPLFRFNCQVSVLFQNANLFRKFYNINFFKWLFSLDSVRYFALIVGKSKVDDWYVFSPIAKSILKSILKKYVNIKLINLFSANSQTKIEKNYKKEYDFIYPASYLPHKNHEILKKTLIKLSKKKIFPKTLITLPPNIYKKTNYEELKNKYNIKVFNYFEDNNKEFIKIYKKCKSLIYFSSNETIALPIIEAWTHGRMVLDVPELFRSRCCTRHEEKPLWKEGEAKWTPAPGTIKST